MIAKQGKDDVRWRRYSTAKEKFDSMFKIDASGCWLWAGSLVPGHGYGSFNFKGSEQGAHRASYILHRGVIPEGLFVLHKCDVKHCVNPEHLFLGTLRDNAEDRNRKGRQAKGPKLSAALKACWRPDRTGIPLSKEHRKKLSIARLNSPKNLRGENLYNCKLTSEKVVEIFYSNEENRKIAKRFGVHPSQVGNIKHKRAWKHVTHNL